MSDTSQTPILDALREALARVPDDRRFRRFVPDFETDVANAREIVGCYEKATPADKRVFQANEFGLTALKDLHLALDEAGLRAA